MSLLKSTTYAPDIYKALNGILLIHKPAGIHSFDLIRELRERISDQLSEYGSRPLSNRLVIDGDIHEDKILLEVPNLADHPLVVGPRYSPWEINIGAASPYLTSRMSGVQPLIMGHATRFYSRKLKNIQLVNVFQITGKFGHCTDNMFSDGKIIDKSTYKHIKLSKLDGALSRIEATQRNRLFDAANIPLNSEEAYQMAKAWPSRPPKFAKWPVIYRLRCIHLRLPEFKIEVSILNPRGDETLAHLCQDVGLALKSSAYTESIRRVKIGIFDISDCLTSSEWDLQSIVNNLKIHSDYRKVHEYLNNLRSATEVRIDHDISDVPKKIAQNQDS